MSSAMRRNSPDPRLVVFSRLVTVALTAATVVTLPACNLCGNQVIRRVPSPDGRRVAVIFERDCGTTGFSTQVSILDGASEPTGSGNVFIADTNLNAAPPALCGGPDVQVQWHDSKQLTIAHHPAARVFRRTSSQSDIAISYASLDATEPKEHVAEIRWSKRPIDQSALTRQHRD
jgi:hypothetical protein